MSVDCFSAFIVDDELNEWKHFSRSFSEFWMISNRMQTNETNTEREMKTQPT